MITSDATHLTDTSYSLQLRYLGSRKQPLEQKMSDKIILLTGISGFIAKHCAVEMLRAGYRVRGTVRDLSKADKVRATLAKHCDVSKLEFVAADLMADAGWAEAAKGVYGVLHVASPFIIGEPKDENELIRPAVDGTMRVLKAAIAAGAKRFVQTSSIAAMMAGHGYTRTKPFTEDDWTILDGPDVSAYQKSKTLAERAARDYLAQTKADIHYASVNPGFVLGPLLDSDYGASASVIQMFMKGKYPGCPALSFPCVDVRDIGKMHRLALETSEPSGGRYVGVSESAWFVDMTRAIKAKLNAADTKKVPTKQLPNFVIKLIALFDKSARSIVPDLGRQVDMDNSRTRKALGMEFKPVSESAPAMAQSLVDEGLV
jgi:dihydroflavonol-4-reductase